MAATTDWPEERTSTGLAPSVRLRSYGENAPPVDPVEAAALLGGSVRPGHLLLDVVYAGWPTPLARAFEESQRYQRPLSLAIVDLDFFKKVNDTYGHAIGDEVLKAVSRIFGQSIRSTDLAARYGGEEFAVMMPETELNEALAFAEKIRGIVEGDAVPTQAGPIQVTVSIGVGTVPHSRIRSAKELIIAADKALYRAKKNGRNQVQAERRQDPSRKTLQAPLAAAK